MLLSPQSMSGHSVGAARQPQTHRGSGTCVQAKISTHFYINTLSLPAPLFFFLQMNQNKRAVVLE